MKKIVVLFVLFSFTCFSQEKKEKYDISFSPELIGQKEFFGGANILIGKVVIEKMIIGMNGVRFGFETNLRNSSEFLIAPKIGIEASGTIFIMRISALNYFQNSSNEFRILPEIGISWAGFINLTYGYNFRISSSQIDNINEHRLCLSFNFNRKLIKEGLKRM